VAVLGPNAKFTVKSFRDEQDALKALKSGEIALLATGSPNFINTATRASVLPAPSSMTTSLFREQDHGIASPRDLAGKKVCYLGGTEIEMQIQSYMQRENIKWLPSPFRKKARWKRPWSPVTAPPSAPTFAAGLRAARL